MPKEKYESPNPRRAHTLMSPEDVAAGKKSTWFELEITGMYICITLHRSIVRKIVYPKYVSRSFYSQRPNMMRVYAFFLS